MANRKFCTGIPAIALIFWMTAVGCSKGLIGGGGFTLTGIPPEYNGKYAALVGVDIKNTNLAYAGYQSANGKDQNKLCRISNGQVSIPVWTVDKSANIKRYSGSDTLYSVAVSIYNSETQAVNEPEKPLAVNMFMSVDFSNGNAAKSWNNGMATGEGTLLDTIFKGLEGIMGGR